METEFLNATYVTLGLNLLFTLVTLVVSVILLIGIDRLLLKEINLQQEIKNGNVAASIFASSIMLFIAIIVGMGASIERENFNVIHYFCAHHFSCEV